MKALAVSVVDMLNDFAGESFRGGSNLLFDATLDGVALPMQNSRFSNFTQAQYDTVLAQLASGAVVVSTVLPEPGGSTNPNDLLDITGITVNFIS
jgi:basic membrane protein A